MKNKIALSLVLFVVFLDEMGMGLVYPMFSSMLFLPSGMFSSMASDTIRSFYLGLLLAAPGIAAFFSGPILGALSDQKGRRPLYIITLSIAIFGYALAIIAVYIKHMWILILARFVCGIAMGNAGVVSATVADLCDKKSKAKYFGLYSMAAGVGFMIGPFLGGMLSKISFLLPFIFTGSLNVINLLFICFFFKETFPPRKKVSIKYMESIKNIKKAFKHYELAPIFGAVIIFCFAWSFFYEFIPVTWIADYNFDAGQVALFYAYGALFYAASSGFFIRPFVDKYNNYSLIFYSVAGLGISILTCLILKGVWFILLYLPLVNFLIALAYPTYSAIVSNTVDDDSQGEIMGILQSIQMLAFGISPLVGGWLLGLSKHAPMLVGGIAMLIAAAILGFFLKNKIFQSKSDVSF
jgi:DHA1 family tetracycline resistance protein-like MFS transporter